jgi:hypothetical protein
MLGRGFIQICTGGLLSQRETTNNMQRVHIAPPLYLPRCTGDSHNITTPSR